MRIAWRKLNQLNMPNHSSQLKKAICQIFFFREEPGYKYLSLKESHLQLNIVIRQSTPLLVAVICRSCEGNIFRLSYNQSRLCKFPLLFPSFLEIALSIVLFRWIASLECIFFSNDTKRNCLYLTKGASFHSSSRPDWDNFCVLGQNTLPSQCPFPSRSINK